MPVSVHRVDMRVKHAYSSSCFAATHSGQMKNWTWTWNTSFATDAEGVVMCSVYDRDDMHRENESRGINSRHGSRSGSRPGTRGSNGTGGQLKGSLHFSTDDAQDASIRVAPIMSEELRFVCISSSINLCQPYSHVPRTNFVFRAFDSGSAHTRREGVIERETERERERGMEAGREGARARARS